MLQPSFARYADFADKVKVRDHIGQKGLAHLLPALYGVWEDAREIDFEALPQKFALKTNHGCGDHVLCTDKNSLEKKTIVDRINKLLRRPYSIREPHYKYIEPKVYAEELLETPDGGAPTDYKFICAKGRVMCIQTCYERDEHFEHPMRTCFDTDWNPLPWVLKRNATIIPARPVHLEDMIEVAEKISSDFDYVRVDLYNIDGRIVFGELTFTPASGLLPAFTDKALVEWAAPLMSPSD